MNEAFPGFPPEALTFFRSLARNNRREWFQPRKETFETTVRQPMIALVEALNIELEKFAPDYVNDPKKAIYRIYRDTRFSSDKTPYKTHIAALFPKRGSVSKHASPGFFFAVSHKSVELAGGVYGPQPEDLLAIRNWIATNHASLRKAARKPAELIGDLKGSTLQRVPKGFDAAHPAADLLKMKQWYYGCELEAKLAASDRLVPELIRHFRAMAPVLELLGKALSKPKVGPKPSILF
jgi:uncharacterized protein (TIGR02453 family)